MKKFLPILLVAAICAIWPGASYARVAYDIEPFYQVYDTAAIQVSQTADSTITLSGVADNVLIWTDTDIYIEIGPGDTASDCVAGPDTGSFILSTGAAEVRSAYLQLHTRVRTIKVRKVYAGAASDGTVRVMAFRYYRP